LAGFVVGDKVGTRLHWNGGGGAGEENALVGIVNHTEDKGLTGSVGIAVNLAGGSGIYTGRLREDWLAGASTGHIATDILSGRREDGKAGDNGENSRGGDDSSKGLHVE